MAPVKHVPEELPALALCDSPDADHGRYAGTHHARFIDPGVPYHVISRVFQGRCLLAPHCDWSGTMWDEYVATALPTADSQAQCLRYILGQGVKDPRRASLKARWIGLACTLPKHFSPTRRFAATGSTLPHTAKLSGSSDLA